jgi:hypothetical protein
MSRAALAVLAFLFFTGVAQGQTTPPQQMQRIRGDIVGVDGLNLRVKERSGETLAVKLADNYTVNAVVKIDIARIVPGSFVGTATLPQPDGTQSALEVLLLPESRRGSGEGHYPWDLQPGSMMTNATVADVVAIDQTRKMTLRYKDGEKVVVVPPAAPIVTFEPGDRSMVKPGAHVIIGASKQPDGTLSAASISIGKDGLVPPM